MKSYLVLIAAILFAGAPFLSPEFGGIPPEIYPVPQDKPPVQPAGWAFAIWAVIYLGLILHGLYGVWKCKEDVAWEHGRFALLISLGVGIFWLPVALVSPIWATLMIWVMLIGALVSLYETCEAQPSCVAVWPVGLYAGWLTAASFVSIGLLLGGYGIMGETNAAIVALVLASVFAWINQHKLRHWTYGFAVVWGLCGIAVANFGSQTMVLAVAALAAVSLVLKVLFQLFQDIVLTELD